MNLIQKIEVAKRDLIWLWLYYPGYCAPPSAIEKIVYGISGSPLVGADMAQLMTHRHARALDIRTALADVTPRERSILRLAYHPNSGPIYDAVSRVRNRYFRQGGSVASPAERRTAAEAAMNRALIAYADALGVR